MEKRFGILRLSIDLGNVERAVLCRSFLLPLTYNTLVDRRYVIRTFEKKKYFV